MRDSAADVGCVVAIALLALAAGTSSAMAQRDGAGILELESKIPLGTVTGRIDHLALDPSRKRVFIAELENNSVAIVDLGGGKLRNRISGLREPQGVGYVPSVDMLYVANGGDGTVRAFKGEDFAAAERQVLDSDADNVRVDADTARVYVGYGAGALAVIDPASQMRVRDIALPAHPESFQISRSTRQIFVNLPNAGAIVVLDGAGDGPRWTWSTANYQGNFAMALDEEHGTVVIVYRRPAKISVRAIRDGAVIADRDTCGDADDVFVDSKRQRLYVTCGEGFIDVFDAVADYTHLARIATRHGARTSLYMPTLDRLAVAVRASWANAAELWVYRPLP
jgi:DNA-binding beta-propeller fold protein YncE